MQQTQGLSSLRRWRTGPAGLRHRVCTRQRLIIKALNEQKEKDKSPPSPPSPPKKNDKEEQMKARQNAVLEDLKKSGMDMNKARKLLATWAKVGVNDPEQLRKLLIKRSLQPLSSTLFQTVIDAAASFGGFYLAYLAGQSGDMPFRIIVELAGNFAGLYYFLNVVLELGVAAAILYSTYRYGTSSVEVLAAVQQLAGPGSGVTILDKAAAAVNMFKVLQALDEVAQLLKEQYGDNATTASGNAADSLRNLSALLTLARAKDELGFKPEQYGLSERQAGNIAVAFSVYDTNDNGRLELSEIGNLCSSLGRSLDDAELKEAVKTLDKDGNGYVDFVEFVEWWCQKRGTAS